MIHNLKILEFKKDTPTHQRIICKRVGSRSTLLVTHRGTFLPRNGERGIKVRGVEEVSPKGLKLIHCTHEKAGGYIIQGKKVYQ